MPKNVTFLILWIWLAVLSGCAPLHPRYESPVVTITSFDAVPTRGLAPNFRIGLRVINPNRTELRLHGLSYSIALEGHTVMTGVSNQLPVIPAYGEGEVVLNASVDLFSSVGFITDLIRNKGKSPISYELKTKLDAGTFHPLIRVSRKGSLSLSEMTHPREQDRISP